MYAIEHAKMMYTIENANFPFFKQGVLFDPGGSNFDVPPPH
jgi:hypothetical protein